MMSPEVRARLESHRSAGALPALPRIRKRAPQHFGEQEVSSCVGHRRCSCVLTQFGQPLMKRRVCLLETLGRLFGNRHERAHVQVALQNMVVVRECQSAGDLHTAERHRVAARGHTSTWATDATKLLPLLGGEIHDLLSSRLVADAIHVGREAFRTYLVAAVAPHGGCCRLEADHASCYGHPSRRKCARNRPPREGFS